MPNPPATSHVTMHYGPLVITTIIILVASLMILYYPGCTASRLAARQKKVADFWVLLCENVRQTLRFYPAFRDTMLTARTVIRRSIHYSCFPTHVCDTFIAKHVTRSECMFNFFRIFLGRAFWQIEEERLYPCGFKNVDTCRNYGADVVLLISRMELLCPVWQEKNCIGYSRQFKGFWDRWISVFESKFKIDP